MESLQEIKGHMRKKWKQILRAYDSYKANSKTGY